MQVDCCIDHRVDGQDADGDQQDGHLDVNSLPASGIATRPTPSAPHAADAGRPRKTAWARMLDAYVHRYNANNGRSSGRGFRHHSGEVVPKTHVFGTPSPEWCREPVGEC